MVEYLLLGYCVKRRRRLVENNDVRLGIKRSRHRQLLPLTARKLYARRIEIFHKLGVVSVRQLFYVDVSICHLCRFPHSLGVFFRVYIAEADVILHAFGILAEILENNSEKFVIILDVILTKVVSVKKYLTVGGIVKSCEQFYKRGLSRAVKPDEHHRLTRTENEIHVINDLSVCSGIGEADVLKFDRVPYSALCLKRLVRYGNNGRFFLKERDEVIYEQSSLVDRCRNTYELRNI